MHIKQELQELNKVQAALDHMDKDDPNRSRYMLRFDMLTYTLNTAGYKLAYLKDVGRWAVYVDPLD